MRKIFKFTSVFVLVVSFGLGNVQVSAQTSSTENSRIEQRLEQEGLNEAPDVVEVEQRTMQGEAPSSGFVDENGRPLSDDEYKNWNNQQKGIFRKYPWLLPVMLLAVGGVVFAVIKISKKRS